MDLPHPGHSQRKRFQGSVGPGTRSLYRRPIAGNQNQVVVFPGRKPLGRQTPEFGPLAEGIL